MAFRLSLAILFIAACGGSSSESPWPVEPVDMEGAPVGEDDPGAPPPDTSALDNYGEGGAGAVEDAPETTPEEP